MIYRVLCCAISFIVRVFVLQNTNTITNFHAIVHNRSPLPPRNIHVGSPIAGSQIRPRWHYDACSIASCASTSPPSHHERWGVRRSDREVLSHCDCTTSCHRWFVPRLWLSEVARCTQRGFFEATAGECDELDTTSCQHSMNGDCFDEDNCK